MRYIHTAIESSKQAFVVRLSFILSHLNAKITQRELAIMTGVSPSTISCLKNNRHDRVSINSVLRVADALKLEYTVSIVSRNGKSKSEVVVESAVAYMARSSVIQNQGRGFGDRIQVTH